MSTRGTSERAAAWIYRGVWRVLVDWFRVPDEPPRLPAADDAAAATAVRPAPGFLRYLKFYFWIGLLAADLAIIGAWLAVLVWYPLAGVLLAIPAWALAILPDIVVYVGLHLRYDTTWYLLTDRALRIRRGIWTIHETTITYENIQNVTVRQGPVQRWFGIADVVVTTAGGGGHGGSSHHAGAGTHLGLVEGIAEAPSIRDRIMSRVRASTTTGLGDEVTPARCAESPGWSAAHVAVLREIRDRAAELASGTPA